MAQTTNYEIENSSGLVFRGRVNEVFAAVQSNNSGATEPTGTVAYQLWYDTTTNILKMRNASNAAWISLFTVNQTNGVWSVNANSTSDALRITQTGTGNALLVEDSANPDSTPFVVTSSGNVGIGISTPTTALEVVGQASFDDGTAAVPSITNTGDLNTGIFFPAADTVAVTTGGSERIRVGSTGNVGIGTLAPTFGLHVNNSIGNATIAMIAEDASNSILYMGDQTSDTVAYIQYSHASNFMNFRVNSLDRVRIDSSGNLLVGKTADNDTSAGIRLSPVGVVSAVRDSNLPLLVNRLTNDGTLVDFRQDNVVEGTISVSGTTVSYNGGHLSRWAQLTDNSRPEILKGTIMSNLDQMSNWDNEDNEQLNCVQISTVEGDANVAGVFVAWDSTDDGYNDILLAMTGDMVIRIGAGVTVARGDLLMSAGDGTAKPQSDDIVRSKTIAKVTSTHVSHTYADGSYAVPCVLMAC